MLFNSYPFLLAFLPVTLLGFYWLGRRGYRTGGLIWLLAASLFFYQWWRVEYLALILGSIGFNFAVGRKLAEPAGARRAWMTVGVSANLATLGFFKYANFAVDNLAALGLPVSLGEIVLPLAISFFTFQQIAYLVDVYRDPAAAEETLTNYALFIAFFPQLIAGPIVRHDEMLPQLHRALDWGWSRADMVAGMSLFLAGLSKKVLLADHLSSYAGEVFTAASTGAAVPFVAAWAGALAYTLQLYFDFSGYSDMAIGLGFAMGLRLPENFDSPYKATSIVEFWRRWHMTLSRFLRDYLYIPLGGNRHGPVRRYVNLFVTMLLGGLWHGAGWTFVFWGGLHGTYLLVNHAYRSLRGAKGRREISRPGRIAGQALTFVAVVVGWVFFRAESFGTATQLLAGMAGLHGFAPAGAIAAPEPGAAMLAFLGVLLGVVFFAPNTAEIFRLHQPGPDLEAGLRQRFAFEPNLGWGVVAGLLLAGSFIALAGPSEFLYFQF